jgi:hypothetical protein
VVDDAVPDFPGEVEASAISLEVVDDPEALFTVPERTVEIGTEGLFPEMSEWCVSEVMSKGDRLGEVLVEAEGTSDRPGDLGDL